MFRGWWRWGWRGIRDGDDAARAGVPVPGDDDDRTAWNQRWAAMPHRRLAVVARNWLRAEAVTWFGTPAGFTIALAPTEFVALVTPGTRVCPICGGKTTPLDRWPARLSPTWASGLSLGYGVWVHPPCFEGCPEAGEPAPVPW